MKNSNLVLKEAETPIGIMVFGSSEKGLCLLDFKYRNSFPRILQRIKKYYGDSITDGTSNFIELAENELTQYLQGSLKVFTVPLRPIIMMLLFYNSTSFFDNPRFVILL